MVRRIYVEKKKAFAVKAKELRHEARNYLGLANVDDVRIFIRYDVENISDETWEKAVKTVFAEPPVDDVYLETLPEPAEEHRVFSVEYLPGQFDQRADSAEQCIRFLNENEKPTVRSATTYMVFGQLSYADIKKIEDHDESLQKKREWLIFRAAPVLAFLGLPIASVLAIMRSNKMHNKAFDIAKDDLFDDPQLVLEALKTRLGDQT